MAALWGAVTAREIFKAVKGIRISGSPHTVFDGFSTDSRTVRPGEIFCALKGERFDGHDFLSKALERGARGLLVEKAYRTSDQAVSGLTSSEPVVITVKDCLEALGWLAAWWRHKHRVSLVAITGSAGKTTSKEMTALILQRVGKTLKNEGNLNNLIGLPLTLLQLDGSFRKAVLEMGMNRPGEIARLTEIADPDVGVITNVARAHLEGVGDLDGVARAKVELVEKISREGKVVLNGDDALLMKTAALFRKEVLTFGLGGKNALRATRIQNLGRHGLSFRMDFEGNSWPVRLEVPGLHNVMNALASAAAALCLEVPGDVMVQGLRSFRGVKGRFQVSALSEKMVLVDDTYNANPSSLEAAVQSLHPLLEEGRRIFVALGEMFELGNATIEAHYDAGRMIAALGPYRFLAIGAHASEMINGAIEAGVAADRAGVAQTHDEIVKEFTRQLRAGDLVFVKGSRRMGMEKVVEGLKRLFP